MNLVAPPGLGPRIPGSYLMLWRLASMPPRELQLESSEVELWRVAAASANPGTTLRTLRLALPCCSL